MKTLDRYLLREALPLFGGGLLVIVLLFRGGAVSEVLAPRRYPKIGNGPHGHSRKRFPRVFLASYALSYALFTLVEYSRKKGSIL